MLNNTNLIMLISLLLLALMAGLFFSWTVSVIPGLAKLEDKSYLEAMQSLNRAILNPAFFVVFLGSIVALPLVTFFEYKSGTNKRFYLLMIASLIYLIGSVGVTFLGNVPINNQLEVLDISTMKSEQLKSFRSGFESKWNTLNLIRTISSATAFGLFLFAILSKSES